MEVHGLPREHRPLRRRPGHQLLPYAGIAIPLHKRRRAPVRTTVRGESHGPAALKRAGHQQWIVAYHYYQLGVRLGLDAVVAEQRWPCRWQVGDDGVAAQTHL